MLYCWCYYGAKQTKKFAGDIKSPNGDFMELDDKVIFEADLETVYELLKIFYLQDELSKVEKQYLSGAISKVKEGINVKFNLIFFLTDNFDEDIKNQMVTVPNSRYGRQFSLEAFSDELEERTAFGKKVLLDLNHEEGFFRGNQE